MHRYSPLTFAQNGRLSGNRFGVGLVFASEALGLNQLIGNEKESNVFSSWESRDEGDLGLKTRRIPDDIHAPNISKWLAEYYSQNKANRKLICYQYVDNNGTDIDERLRIATDFCAKRSRSKTRMLRVIFVLSPPAIYQWFLLPTEDRDEIANKLDASVPPVCWNETGLKLRLEHLELPSSVTQVIEATGGWPWLLDHLFDEHFNKEKSSRDLSKQLDVIKSSLQDRSSSLYESFLDSFGLGGDELPLKKIFQFICEHDIQDTEDLVEFIEIMYTDLQPRPEQIDATVQTFKHLGLVKINATSLEVDPFIQRVYGSSRNK